MLVRALVATSLLGLALSAQAETPNIEPGMWEYKNKMIFQSDFPIPDQEHTSEECVTLDDIERGDAFLDDVDECEITRKEMRQDGMDYAMVCRNPDGTEMTMDAKMQFNGDTASGLINGQMQTQMGDMSMQIEMQGRRIGDC